MPTSEDQDAHKPNGTIALLSRLAHSGNAWVQFGIVILVGLSGLGNWIATWDSADRNKAEIEISRRVAWESEQRIKAEMVRQIAEIHRWLDQARTEFHTGNEDSAANRKMLEELTKKPEQ
jgi:Flp pilus assembly protein TadB